MIGAQSIGTIVVQQCHHLQAPTVQLHHPQSYSWPFLILTPTSYGMLAALATLFRIFSCEGFIVLIRRLGPANICDGVLL